MAPQRAVPPHRKVTKRRLLLAMVFFMARMLGQTADPVVLSIDATGEDALQQLVLEAASKLRPGLERVVVGLCTHDI